MERTSISDVKQHGHEDVVHEIQGDAVSEQSVPHHQQVLEGKFTTEQEANPPAERQRGGRGGKSHRMAEEQRGNKEQAIGLVVTDMP